MLIAGRRNKKGTKGDLTFSARVYASIGYHK